MAKIHVEAKETKIGEKNYAIPDEILEKGEEAVKQWLIRTNKIKWLTDEAHTHTLEINITQQ